MRGRQEGREGGREGDDEDAKVKMLKQTAAQAMSVLSFSFSFFYLCFVYTELVPGALLGSGECERIFLALSEGGRLGASFQNGLLFGRVRCAA